jgi:transposase
MDEEMAERKQAMILYHVQHLSKAAICRKLQRSRPWLDRWLARYDPTDVTGSLQDHERGAAQQPGKWSNIVRQQVLQMRRERSQEAQWRYAYKGAEAIYLELKALGCDEVPPIRTIHAWFQAAGLVAPRTVQPPVREKKILPIPVAERVNRVQQLDLKGPIYLSASPTKYYLAVLRDGYSQRCAITVLNSRSVEGILTFLASAWSWMGRPDYLQVDNALEFRGSNRYPRSFGQFVRFVIYCQVEVLFNPPHEPWRNGGIEWFNSFLASHLLTVPFVDRAALRAETERCQIDCNQLHRLAEYDGQTPNELAAQASLRLLPALDLDVLLKNLPRDRGFVSFVRRVRRSGRITLGNGDRFMVDPQLANQYVLARVDLCKAEVSIFHQDRLICTYDFSYATVGMWAADEPSPVPNLENDEVVKVPSKV